MLKQKKPLTRCYIETNDIANILKKHRIIALYFFISMEYTCFRCFGYLFIFISLI